ncbi:MAG: sulfur carrier protein ThiS [Fuerstiella sp.]|jgi:sulfur carrier protein|nr:sulfur carrier protein ThiS [Fuerstiella sp.]
MTAKTMIDILLNGETRAVSADCTIADLLFELDIKNRYCAVERNQELIPREEHAACKLTGGDCVEIVTLVGGG